MGGAREEIPQLLDEDKESVGHFNETKSLTCESIAAKGPIRMLHDDRLVVSLDSSTEVGGDLNRTSNGEIKSR